MNSIRWIVALLVFAVVGSGQEPLDQVFERGLEAYRAEAYPEAESVWSTLFATEDLSDSARAQLALALGNVAWRTDQRGDAVGWYTRAVRLAPRYAPAWRNLEFARGELGLEPHDRGDLRSTVRRVVTSLRATERRNLALLGLLLGVGVAVLELLFGGATLRRLALAGVVLGGLALVPWLVGLGLEEHDPLLVVADRAPDLRSEPNAARKATAELVPGEIVERLDVLPGWVRVEASGGRRGWVPAATVFALVRR